MLRHPVESAPYQMRRQKKLILINLFSLDSLLNSQCSITILRTYLRHPFWEGSNLVRKCEENNHYWDVVGGGTNVHLLLELLFNENKFRNIFERTKTILKVSRMCEVA